MEHNSKVPIHSSRLNWYWGMGAFTAILLAIIYFYGSRAPNGTSESADNVPIAASSTEHAARRPTENPIHRDARRPGFNTSFNDYLMPRRDAPQGLLSMVDSPDSPPSEENIRTSVEYARYVVKASHPELATYRKLAAKVLRTADEERELGAKLADNDLLESAEAVLLDPAENVFTTEGEVERISEVNYLIDALGRKDNPNMSAVLATIESIITDQNVWSDLPLDLRQSLAGDKLELFWALHEKHPEIAARIINQAKGTRLEKLLAFAQRPASEG